MRLFRYASRDGDVRPGMLDQQGRLRDLSYVLMDLTTDLLSPVEIDILNAIEPDTLPPIEGAPTLGPPVAGLGGAFLEGERLEGLALEGPSCPMADRPVRTGLAAVVGAPAWTGAFMAVRADLDAGRAALGPWLSAPDRPYRLHKLRHATGASLGLDRRALDRALAGSPDARPGDLLLLLTPPSVGKATFEVADFGRQG